MESKRVYTSAYLTIDKLSGNGQGVCDRCKVRHWTDWLYKINHKVVCDNCIKTEIQEELVAQHTKTETNKIMYAETHLKILALQREERQLLKDICKSQSEELKLSEFYERGL